MAQPKIVLPFLFLSFFFNPLISQLVGHKTALVKRVGANDSFTGKVVGVSDGDTIKVMCEGRAVKVRLHGVDCPEKKQPYGTRAKQYTSDMAFGKEVTVQIKTTRKGGRC